MRAAIQSFLAYINNERRYSRHTLQAYQRDLEEFQVFIDQSGGGKLAELTYQDMRLFLAYLNERGLSSTTISRKLSSLRSFFAYCLRREWIDQDPMELITYKAKKERLPDFFYEEEISQLLEAARCDQAPHKERNLALLELLYGTGMRVSECVGLKLTQVDLDRQWLRVIGKGNKERLIPFGDPAALAVKSYLSQDRPRLVSSESGDFLFLSDKGKPLTRHQLRRILQALVDQHHLTVTVHPHKFRHSFATHLLDHGADLRSVQELLGHENLSSTQIYTHISNASLKKAYLNAFPRAKRQSKEESE